MTKLELDGAFATLVILMLLGCGDAPSRGPSPDERPNRIGAEEDLNFYRLLRLVKVTEVDAPSSPRALLAAYTTVVTGRIVEIGDGRLLGGPDSPRPIKTFMAKLEVDAVVKGHAGQHVFFEYYRTSFSSVERLRGVMPEERMLLFLVDAQDSSAAERQAIGMPAGETLHALVSSQGMVIEEDEALIHPLVGPTQWLLQDQPDLEAATDLLSEMDAAR